jgi:hypothetical protein
VFAELEEAMRMSGHDAPGEDEIDPTRMIDQPALRPSNGLVWLLVGGILTLVCGGLLLLLTAVDPAIAWTGAISIAVLYLAMIAVRLLVRPRRARLLSLAVLFCVITAVGFFCVLAIAGEQGAALR